MTAALLCCISQSTCLLLDCINQSNCLLTRTDPLTSTSLSPSHSLINSSAARLVSFYQIFTAGNGVSASPRAPRQTAPKLKHPRPPPAPASPRDAPSQPPPELGEYASGRPRRHTKTPGYRLGSNVEDEHQMVEPEHYRGIPGSGAAEAQPFRIEVTPCAQVCIASLTLPVQASSALQACCFESQDL